MRSGHLMKTRLEGLPRRSNVFERKNPRIQGMRCSIMTTKELLMNEIEKVPEPLLSEVLFLSIS